MNDPQPYRPTPAPYPTTVEEILAATWLQPPAPGPYAPALVQHPAPVSVVLVNPAAGAYPSPSAPGYLVPQQYYAPAPVAPAPQGQASASVWSDMPMWLRLSIGTAAFGIGTAGVGVGIGQAAPGISALAGLLWAASALGAVVLAVWLLAPRQRQQQTPGVVTNITNNISAGNSTAVGRQRNNRY